MLAAVRTIPVCLVGGVTSLAAAEGAIREGFAFVQMARALIREPGLVNRIRNRLSNGDSGDGNFAVDTESPCIHCNECVVRMRFATSIVLAATLTDTS